VLDHLGVIDSLGDLASSMSVPILPRQWSISLQGLFSAFASTTGMLAVLVPWPFLS